MARRFAKALLCSAALLSGLSQTPALAELTCGAPVSEAHPATAADAAAIMAAALGTNYCANNVCDFDGNGVVTAVDAHAALGGDVPRCTTEPPARGDGMRARPGENGCEHAIVLERCRIRAARGKRSRGGKVACQLVSPERFPGGLDAATQAIALFLDDTDGPCFEASVAAGTCEQRRRAIVCRTPNPSVDKIVVKQQRGPSVRGRLVAKSSSPLGCLTRSSSPWTVGFVVGTNCGEVGCPVSDGRPECPGTCGNGSLDPGEQCDAGGDTESCSDLCTTKFCGDGSIDPPEECDDGQQTATCDADCTLPVCGDGVVNVSAGESCDDGNDTPGDGCSEDCAIESCGNGVIDAGEQCDDAGESASCDSDCTAATCGDGRTNTTAGEQCDGTDVPSSCAEAGFSGGILVCRQDCTIDTSACIGPLALRCDVVFRVTDSATYGALQWNTDYSLQPGEFVGSGADVLCTQLAGELAAFNDSDQSRVLSSAVISLAGIVGPRDIAQCVFDTNDLMPDPTRFEITVVDSSDTNFEPVPAEIVVSQMSCAPIVN